MADSKYIKNKAKRKNNFVCDFGSYASQSDSIKSLSRTRYLKNAQIRKDLEVINSQSPHTITSGLLSHGGTFHD